MREFNKTNPTVMKHDFSSVPHAEIPRSNFRRSHGLKTTFDSGLLIPIYVDEALPGDTFKLRLSTMARLATPLVPFMDNLHMDFFFFAVPCRLLWENWERFMGAKDDPSSSTDFTVPTVSAVFDEESLGDYFGIPTKTSSLTVNALHFRAYNLIYNNFFRDQNLQDSAVVDLNDGPDTITDYVLRKRGKRHDYFTSALPFPQKGDAVDLPLGDRAPVKIDGTRGDGGDLGILDTNDTSSKFILNATRIEAESAGAAANDLLYADLEGATAATINSLREAFQLQRLLERDARGGTRYTEILKSHFRVTSPDSRLQRPEYLGGGSSPINITPIAQTSESGGTDQGHLAAIGYHSQSGIGFNKSFVEHSVILGLVNVRADLTYQQGLRRMWSRQTKYDYYWPALAHLGEQEILNKEIFAAGIGADEEVFGYQERFAEYRYFNSKITGKLRSNTTLSLDNWHLSQDFAALPLLNSDFIEENVPIARVVAVTTEPEIIYDSFVDVICTRPMPTYSVPGQIDHF